MTDAVLMSTVAVDRRPDGEIPDGYYHYKALTSFGAVIEVYATDHDHALSSVQEYAVRIMGVEAPTVLWCRLVCTR